MSTSFPAELIDFLSRPDSYPHKPERVDHVQTHISHVFIASPHVYKFKKPVNFDFLDFSSLEKRKYYCEQEVELNRRLCDGPYLGVLPLFRKGQTWSFKATGNAEPVEYAVWMQQLGKDHFLSEIAAQKLLSIDHLDRVADKLVPFYRSQDPDENILKWGRPERIRVNTDENFSQTEAFVGRTIDKVTFDSIDRFTGQFLEKNNELFEKRIEEGQIVDGHGDLRLDHIHITGERVCIYDCIEFNDRFRFQDIASDIGFLAMDLDFNGYRVESSHFTKQMAEKLDDADLLRLIDFYKCYRAYVRGKVKSLESSEEEVDLPGRRQAARLAERYFALALNYALYGSKPAVFVFMGRVACGKSTLAKNAAGKLNINSYSSDHVRKKLAGLALNERTPPSMRSQIYKESISRSTYNSLYRYAEKENARGNSVVLDATFGSAEHRSNLISTLKSTDAEIYFIEAQAPVEVREKRLGDRESQGETISDARLEDLEMLDLKYQDPDEIDRRRLIAIDTDQPVERCIRQLFEWFIENGKNQLTK